MRRRDGQTLSNHSRRDGNSAPRYSDLHATKDPDALNATSESSKRLKGILKHKSRNDKLLSTKERDSEPEDEDLSYLIDHLCTE